MTGPDLNLFKPHVALEQYDEMYPVTKRNTGLARDDKYMTDPIFIDGL